MASASDRVRARLCNARVPWKANDNIADYLCPGDMEDIQDEVTSLIARLMDALVIDTGTDHNTSETAQRVSRMLVCEAFAGRYAPRPRLTDFPNVRHVDGIYIDGPIAVRSACSHHLVPILGEAWVGVIPTERVIGLSKFSRLTEWIMARPQIQEEATEQLADELWEVMQPRALAVVIRAQHLCCTWRGVRDNSRMTTSVMRGLFKDDPKARAEFLALIAGSGY